MKKQKKNVIKKEVFDKEIALCGRLYRKNKGECCWGKCKDCGVIPLLYKLNKGQLLDGSAEIKKIKNRVFK
ncbi:MAG: hypothetical protein WC514_02395 [Candidatus Paceibacterota bacterium]